MTTEHEQCGLFWRQLFLSYGYFLSYEFLTRCAEQKIFC